MSQDQNDRCEETNSVRDEHFKQPIGIQARCSQSDRHNFSKEISIAWSVQPGILCTDGLTVVF